MPKRSSKPTKPKDTQQLAQSVLDAVVPDAAPRKRKPAKAKKNPAAVALGRLGGIKGGRARAAKLSKEQLSETARRAANARWSRGNS